MPGTTKDNAAWIERKRAVADRFGHSSWYMKQLYEAKGTTITQKALLPVEQFAPYGGSVPLRVKGVGQIGTVTVSGLPQAEDHKLVVDVMAATILVTER